MTRCHCYGDYGDGRERDEPVFPHHLGLDPNMRDRYRDNPYWQACADFCADYDQNSFDPAYDTLPLEFFEPMVRRIFAAPKQSIYLPGGG